MKIIYCDSCAVDGDRREAGYYTMHPNYRGYDLCAECAREYDLRWAEECGYSNIRDLSPDKQDEILMKLL